MVNRVKVKIMTAVRVFALFVLGCSAVIVTPAQALEPGVHINPNSPAAKEYALPLNQGRATGGGAAKTASGGLFGAGIKPPGGSGSGHAGGTGSHDGGALSGAAGSAGNRSDATGSSSAATSDLPPAVLRAARSSASTGSQGSILALLGGGVAILVLGGLGGTIVRRGHRSAAST